ncbi:MAG: YbgA family protein [Bacteriovoracia bacterium]
MNTQSRPRIGISACLLGQPVRYNGGHKRHDWITDALAKHVDFVPVCPEVAMGLGTPRPALRLQRSRAPSAAVELVETNSGQDLTADAQTTYAQLAENREDIDAFLLKRDSPTCGLERVKIYTKETGIPFPEGVGLFAAELKKRYPDLPMLEEGRLSDLEQKEHFLTQVFAHHQLRNTPPEIAALQRLHRRHKFLLLEHGPTQYQELGRIVANSENLSPVKVKENYRHGFAIALRNPPRRGTRVNVLEHAMGFLRDQADDLDRKQLAESIQEFQAGKLPFLAPLTVAYHLIKKFQVEYLLEQTFFSPYPRDLGGLTRL